MTRRPRTALTACALLVAAGSSAGFGHVVVERAGTSTATAQSAGAAPWTRSLPDFPPLTDAPAGGARRPAPTSAAARAGAWTAHLERPALLRDSPGGRSLGRVGRRTGYGARRVFAVGALRPGWVGVRSQLQPNDQLAWLPQDAVRLAPIRTTLVTDLSERELTVRVDGKVRYRVPVGIGRPGSETPLGRYGVTDRLQGGAGAGAAYGCCVIPLTGNQPKPPPGWTGGTRLALHGTPTPGSVGQEVSAGCLRMRDADILRVFPAVPLGATMRVRA